MPILTVDTTNGIATSTIVDVDNNILSSLKCEQSSKQAEVLIAQIEENLKASDLSYKDLKALAVCVGPGSFTGLRIGIAAVRGLNIVLKLPTISVTSFEAIVAEASSNIQQIQEQNILVVIDARREQLYCQYFSGENLQEKSEYYQVNTNDFLEFVKKHNTENLMLTGNGCPLATQQIKNSNIKFKTINELALPNAENVAIAASQKLKQKDFSNPKPLYVRTPDAIEAS